MTSQVSQAVMDASLARLLLKQAPASQAGGLFIAVTMIAIFSDQLLAPTTLMWIGLFVSTLVLRGALWRHYRDRIDRDDALAMQWQRSLLYALGYSGFVWAIAAWIYVDQDQPLYLGLYIAIFACLFAGAVGSLAPSVLGYAVYCLPIAIVVVWGLLTTDGFPAVAALGFTGFFIVCLLYTRNLNQTLIGNVRLQFQNQSLVDELQEKAAALQAAVERAEEANESKSRFLAVATHDLAQPLHALELFVAALKRETSADKQQTLIANVDRSAERLAEMFSSLLDMSRLESQVVQADLTNVSLKVVLEPLISESRANAVDKGLTFTVDYPDVVLQTDATLLHRVLLNLINNAIINTEQGGIRLTATRQDTHLRLELADTGIGIAPSEHHKVFQEYYQSNPGRGEGMGLGLSIVARLSRLLGIELQMDSMPGQGTTFTLLIPCTDEPEAVAGPRSQSPGDELLASLKVLYIDDMESSRLAMQALLAQWGAVCLALPSAEQIADDMHPDLLITDYRIRPDLTGLEVASACQARWPGLPVLVVTGDTSPEILHEVQRSGLPYLLKPTSEQDLQRAIADLITPV